MATEQIKLIYKKQIETGIRQPTQTGPSPISEKFKVWAKAEREKPETTGEPTFRNLSANQVIDLYRQAKNNENPTVTEAKKFLDKDGANDLSLQIAAFEVGIDNLEYDDNEQAWDDIYYSMEGFSTLFDDLTKSQGLTAFDTLSFKKEYNELIDELGKYLNSNTLRDIKDLVQKLYNLLTDISTGAVK